MLSALKNSVSQAATATTQLFRSPSDIEAHRSSTAASFSAARRRLLQQALQGVGKTAASPDAEWEAHKSSHLALEALLRETRKDVQSYVEAARRLAMSSMRVGATVRSLGVTAGGANSEQLASGLEQVDSTARAALDEDIAFRVIAPIDAMLHDIDRLRPFIRERDLLKLDVDARQRALDALKASEGRGTSHETLLHKAQKLEKTRDALAASTRECVEKMRPLEQESGEGGSLPAALAAFVRGQLAFHEAAAGQLRAGVGAGGEECAKAQPLPPPLPQRG